MKGLVFREFLTMVEKKYGYEMVDRIIEEAKIASKGVYTSVGTYPHSELFALLGKLSNAISVKPEQLLFLFGKYVFQVFLKSYPAFFKEKQTSFEMLADVEGKIHIEVLKLYPEAELPTIDTFQESEDVMILHYSSQRKLSDFAKGLIHACIKYFNENASIEKIREENGGEEVSFRIRRLNE